MQMGWTFVDPATVLVAFVQTLTSSMVLIGLAGAMARLGWAWPQVFISRIVEPKKKKMPFLLLILSGRCLTWFVIGFSTLWLGAGQPGLLLVIFICLYALSSSLMGAGNVPWMDIIGKAIPSWERAQMFAIRRLVGGVLSIVSGGLISYVLSERSEIGFPDNYAVLFLFNGVTIGLSLGIFGLIREPIQPVQSTRMALGNYLTSGINLLREDANFRRLCTLQFLWAFTLMATPFYVPYAISDLGISTAYVGIFVSIMQLSSIFSNLLWAHIGKHKGNQALLFYGTCFLGLAAAIPFLVIYVPERNLIWSWTGETGLNLRVLFFSLTFIFSGFSQSAMYTGRATYMLDLAPQNQRPTYISFMNLFMLPQGLLPILAGAVISWISFRRMFFLALVVIPISLMMTKRLEDIR